MRDRENTQLDVALRGDVPVTIGRHELRPLSFACMLVLQKLEHPLAAIGTGAPLQMSDMQLATAIWVLAAPWEQVREATLACTGEDKTPALRAVLDFAEQISPAELAAMAEQITGNAAEADAVAAEVLPDKNHPDTSKN